MAKDVLELVEQLREECRQLINIPEESFTDRDAHKLQIVNEILIHLEKDLPADYFSVEKSLERFWARPDIQDLIKKDPA